MRSRVILLTGFLGSCAVIGGTVPAAACMPCSVPVADQTAGYTAQGTAWDGMSGVQGNLRDIRDHLQDMTTASSGVLRYNWDPNDPSALEDEDADLLSPVSLAYAKKSKPKNPLANVPAMAPVPSNVQYAAWGQGFYDTEWRSGSSAGVDFGRTTYTLGGIGGADVVVTNVRTKGDAFVFGILTGITSSHVNSNDGSTAQVTGPGVGFYAAYVDGGASIDTSFKVDFFSIGTAAPAAAPLSLGLNNYLWASNLNYKFQNVVAGWWVEPTVGFAYTSTVWNSSSHAQGLMDGTDTRLQAGARIGTSTTWNGWKVEPSLLFRLYDDVSITGGSVAQVVGPTAPNDAGKLFAAATGRLNVAVLNNVSAFVEGELRGTTGVFGAAINGGFRYTFK